MQLGREVKIYKERFNREGEGGRERDKMTYDSLFTRVIDKHVNHLQHSVFLCYRTNAYLSFTETERERLKNSMLSTFSCVRL